MGTFFQPAWAQNCTKNVNKIAPTLHQHCTKIAPKWDQNGTKMAQRWPQDGPKMASWRVLGPFGGQVGPKMEPRGFQGRKTQFVPLMLGPKLGPHFRHFHYQGGSQEAWRPTWITCCVQTPSFRRNVVSQSSPGTPKYSKTAILSSKLRFSACHLKWLWSGDGSWDPFWDDFGNQVGAKLGHVGHQVGLGSLFNITSKL